MGRIDTAPIWFGSEGRRFPRVLTCASVHVTVKGETSEHLTFDLSTGGVRLCGVPRGQAGDYARLRLCLPKTVVTAVARIVRVAEADAAPSFALRFMSLTTRARSGIELAVEDAMRAPVRRSILLLKSGSPRSGGPAWLAPVSSICAPAHTALQAVRHLTDHRIHFGVIGKSLGATSNAAWAEVFPSIEWRTIDVWGRLHRDLEAQLDADPEANFDGRRESNRVTLPPS